MTLPKTLRVLERGWLSCNNVVLLEGERAALVDTGYHTHAEQTLALVREVLDGRRLDRILNTHSHSDHIGGNARLQQAYHCPVIVPAGMAQTVADWDEEALLLKPAAQFAPRFGHQGTLAPGDEFEAGGLVWRALAAPGHDMDALVFHCASHRILISGDALWRDGFGIMFAEIMGRAEGLKATRETLESIGRLAVDWVIPGHGAVFAEFDDALERAFGRIAAFESDPLRMARSAIKACFTFTLLERRRIALEEVASVMRNVPFFNEINTRFLGLEEEAYASWLVDSLVQAGAAEVRQGFVVPRLTA